MPMISTLLHELYPRTESMPSSRQISTVIRHAGMRFIRNFSMMIETTVSISEIEDVIAASATRMKNTAPTI